MILQFVITKDNSVQAAAVSWDGGAATTNWSDANNWSNDAIPTSADDVTINQNITVNIASGTTINSLTLGQPGGGTTPTLNFTYNSILQGGLVIDDGDLTVNIGSTITHSVGTTVVVGKISIDVQSGNATILGSINANAKGYIGNSGPTPGIGNSNGGGGGGHGGKGALGSASQGGGISGTLSNPTELGSGGGGPVAANAGNGGGAIRLTVQGTLNINGSIVANGGNFNNASSFPGAGAGGSIYVTATTISGVGSITSNGGDGATGVSLRGGGGGGGRIALHSTTNSFSGTLTAYGGSGGTHHGGSGTIFTKLSSQTHGSVLIDNNDKFVTSSLDDRVLGTTPLPSATLDSLTISNYGVFEMADSTTVIASSVNWATEGIIKDSGGTFALISGEGDLTIPTSSILFANTPRTYNSVTVNGKITTSWNTTSPTYRVQITTVGNFTVSSTGSIYMNERGYMGNNGPTPGVVGGGNGAGGAGHGGVGAAGALNAGGGVSGSITTPTELGSGGGGPTASAGGYGGGSIILNVQGTLNILGSISVNGGNFNDTSSSPGGGAGGSIYITANTVSGIGTVTSNGGNPSNVGGGGAGGRIAIYSATNSFNGIMTAYGGSGNTNYGGAGTIFTKLSSQTYGSILIDNNDKFLTARLDDRFLGTTPLPSITLDILTISNYGVFELIDSTTVVANTFNWASEGVIKDSGGTFTLISGGGDLTIPTSSILFANTPRTYNSITLNGKITTSWNSTSPVYRLELTVLTNFTISSSGSIFMAERGYMGNSGPTPGLTGGSTGKGGGGHGGEGGAGAAYAGGGTSGTLKAPTELGSGGGGGLATYGGYGGGAMKLTVYGTLNIMGLISSNGGNFNDTSGAPGGGAGGSIYIIATTISGAGVISANGGAGSSTTGGGGGGGRINLAYQSKTFSGSVTVNGGGTTRTGSVGTILDTYNPYNPTNLLQYKADGTTVISSGGITTETTVILKATLSAASNQTLTPEFEVRNISSAFTGTSTHTGEAVNYTGTPVIGTISVLGLADSSSYHWRVRACNSDGDCSAWISFGGTSYDFRVFSNQTPYPASALGPVQHVNGSSINDSTPTFEFTISDPDISNTVSFTIQIATDADYLNTVVEYMSDLETQGAKTFTVGQPLNGGLYLIGNISQSLTDGTYFWRVKSFDEGSAEATWTSASLTTPAFVLDTSSPAGNATNVAFSNAIDGEWTNLEPTITWEHGTDIDGEILGYCLSLSEVAIGDPQPLADPLISAGVLDGLNDGVENDTCPYIATGESFNINAVTSLLLTTNKHYYFSLFTIDTAGNVYQGSPTNYRNLISFKYDNLPPQNVLSISAAGGTFTNISDMYFSWPTSGGARAVDSGGSGLLGYQYALNDQATWKGLATDPLTDQTYIPLDTEQPLHLDPDRDSNVAVGNNIISFRTLDIAGNISSPTTYRLASIAFGGQAPTFGGDAQLTITPTTTDNNLFALSWDSAVASEGNTVETYYYMVNTPPPATLATMEGNSATYFATQSTTVSARELPGVVRGSNIVYVAVVDNIGNYSPSSYLSASFTLNSDNPDSPKNFTIADGSIKEAELWRASLIWDIPDYVGVGNLTYRVQRSADGVNWSYVGSTTGTAYVDTVPESKQYYWRVGSTDPSDISIENPSFSNAQTLIPKGSYTSPADITSGPVTTNITTRRAKILWTTSRDSDSKIAYGTVPGEYQEEEPSNSTQVTDHEINLSNLNPNTTYYYIAKWTDEDGNTGVSSERTFTTESAPIIKEVTTTNIGLESAIVNFTTINANRVRIYYGVSTDFGGVKTVDTSRQESSYSAILTELQDGTKYYFRLNGFDSEGEEYTGDIYSFETLPRPRVSDITLQQVADTAETTVLVSWKSNTAISSIVTVFPTNAPTLERDIIDLKLKSGDHSMVITSLRPSTNYTLIVKGLDKIGNQAISVPTTFTTSVDSRPPSIINMKVIGGTVPPVGFAAGTINAQLVITWDTDEPATSQIEYGEGTGSSYSQKTTEDNNLTTNHVVVVSGLTPSQVYHLRAISRDSANNTGRSIDTVTIAPKATRSALDLVIVNLGQIFNIIGIIK